MSIFRIVLELARARWKVMILEAKIKELEAQISEPIVPVTDWVWLTRSDYLAEMAKVGIKPIDLGTPLDTRVTLTTKAELDRIAPFLVQPADEYVEQIKDCENYALDAMCTAADYHVSGVTLVLGYMPLGYHGFVITMDKDCNKWWLEPNAGFEYAGVWHKIGEEGYQPDKIFI